MDLQLIIAAVLICTLGLPHGALDPVVAHRYGLFVRRSGFVYFILGYLTVCALGLGFWYVSPVIALMFFLGYSAVHFGRDWSAFTSMGGLPYGCLVIGLPVCFHPNEIQSIYQMITSQQGVEGALVVNWISMVFAVTYVLMTIVVQSIPRLRLYTWLELIVLTSCAYLCTPLWYFVIFFCALHSPRHLVAEFASLSESTRVKALIVMIIITLITLGFVILFGIQLRVGMSHLETFTYQAIFIGLAVLTVPHMLLMEWVRYKMR